MPLEKARVYQNVVMKLSVLRFMVKTMSKQGKTDLNRQCESFFATVLNHVYGYDLKNVNNDSMNEAAIDLADERRKLCFQVTATSASEKIKKTIATFNSRELYKTYHQLWVLMLVDKKNYTTTFDTGKHFSFDPKTNILDIDDLLAKAETISLEELTALSAFVDAQLPGVSRALDPGSLLAGAEQVDGKPATTAERYLTATVEEVNSREWKKDFRTICELHDRLISLSRNQREVILYVLQNGEESGFSHRLSMPIQTLHQRLRISQDEMHRYFDALRDANVMDLDDDEHPKKFELTCSLDGSGNDAFTMLKDFLTDEEATRLIVDCDFSILD
ncbi:SMEK domain-containing protein [Caballeronia sp. LjRoot29]|uniref:SMEK domain-containing protein n=1 Tax=Caballeronia sp. LjRoot29 TaxID=3342315 RepID=UPI003ECCCF17